MKQEKWLSLLGLANRARKLVTGEELVTKEIQKQRVHFVLLANDASKNTMKTILNKCNYYNIPVKQVSDRYTLGNAIGKEARVVIGILDKGFSDKLKQLLD
ncbi:YlxQ family RNA-binding protein [Caldibacillus thermolactis]|jgi:ribosomal protein L7Ae-like RNA K-turn-binding protein|uniref:YlxQ family RNA-binding protein n=1 Tax=Pallidibacillus thermolactis TaxID=251051 RepID=A0ABT2WC46_9BACI|nr:YlxQ family RNA-binding protein [Pallidibacillus thermolactis]MCU9593052.1 YlxQ family RNA-binding protein [Pallidibacillus thermolactis]MCU9600718.1 YlxQ family RNA-binding protein [Pallidibacillus thermolactis subsp. kokeshiiformis]MED1672046.1 YlxQ family RNA-binding protein [Pallidibacillus thermolactis subsp. kokeshiiformis]